MPTSAALREKARCARRLGRAILDIEAAERSERYAADLEAEADEPDAGKGDQGGKALDTM